MASDRSVFSAKKYVRLSDCRKTWRTKLWKSKDLGEVSGIFKDEGITIVTKLFTSDFYFIKTPNRRKKIPLNTQKQGE
jgi:hypothetical protein